jgi:hypothetical protein
MQAKTAIVLAAVGVAATAVCLRRIRPWQMTWGATPEELART